MNNSLFADVTDLDAPALIGPQRTVSWRALMTSLASSSSSSSSSSLLSSSSFDRPGSCRTLIVGDTGEDAVRGVFAALAAGLTPVLVHPRWPATMQQAAATRAGVGRPLSQAQRQAVDDDRATIVFSSGSSGAPKAVLHSLSAHRAAAAGAAARVPFGPGDSWLLSLPICHVGGLALIARALHRGGAIALPAPGQSLVDAVVAQRPTHLSIVAAQLRSLVASPAACEALSSAEVVLVGGGPTPSSLLELGLGRGLPLRQTWGLTEMGSQVCTSPLRQPLTCGAPLPGRAVRVADDGELCVSGAGRCSGFVDGDDVIFPFDDDGAYATGDLGRFDDDGASGAGLVIVGRKDLMFISGGENIQPETIAAALSDVDVSVVVVPVTDARFGARPFAFFAGGAGRDDDEVRRLLLARAEALPRFMHPVGYAPLPQEGGLKPRRADLVAAAQASWDASTSTSTSPPALVPPRAPLST